jgi:hypothetical protein
VSPNTLKRGAPAVLDLHGDALSTDQEPNLTDAKTGAAIAGVRVMGKRLARANLMQVSVKIDDDAPKGKYNLVLVDAAGRTSNALIVEVN